MTLTNTSFLDACNRKVPEHTPVWFMRQAGRYLSSYRRIKGSLPVTELARDCDLASEVAVDAVKQLGVDAAILFADIMLPLEGMGVDFRIEENVGPVISNPICSIEDVNALEAFDAQRDVGYIGDIIRMTLEKLDDSVPLIGFSGAPFTLASYMIDGVVRKDLVKTKKMMYGDAEAWELLMEKLTRMVRDYLLFQIKSGVHAVQLFDSWVGWLSPKDYEQFVLPYTKEVFSSIHGVPKIHFCADSSALIELFQRTGADVLSVDWRVQLDEVWTRCEEAVAVQGNLDPAVAVAGGDFMGRRVRSILDSANGHRGHIFSLGHGVLKETEVENLRRVVKMVHKITEKRN
ncbi:MAG: uroporphyrinogen decarboxylase [Candidatus Bathyarchaeia archaeon]